MIINNLILAGNLRNLLREKNKIFVVTPQYPTAVVTEIVDRSVHDRQSATATGFQTVTQVVDDHKRSGSEV